MRLVAAHVRVRGVRGTKAVPSKLDDYEVVCVLEKVRGHWKAVMQIEGALPTNYQEQPLKLASGTMTSRTDQLSEVQSWARQLIVDRVKKVVHMFGLPNGAKVSIFGGDEWVDDSRFKLR